jgi:8-oxo-dGTP diphosphatase
MALPIKHSVAVMIFNGGQVLAIRRPDDDDELPGIWGLPAGTCRGAETVDQVIRRIGREKLGVTLDPIRKITFGTQDRPAYRLEMELWEVSMQGAPTYREWKWSRVDVLVSGAHRGSLCCELALRSNKREIP